MLNLLDETMWNYIWKDLGKELEYLPYAIIFGILAYLAMKMILPKMNQKAHYFFKAVFLIYLFALVHITLFEREPGSRTAISLTLFETLGGSRNNAYVIENILLFIPFGFLNAELFRPMRNLVLSLITGGFCSLAIETIQLVTQRGYFQMDDILMNSIGTLIGCACFWIIAVILRACRNFILKWNSFVRI